MLSLCETGSEADVKKYHLNWFGNKKIDGCRCLAICENGNVKLVGRSGTDYTNKFLEVVEELKEFKGIFDAEIVCEDFDKTASRVHTENKLKSSLLAKEYPAKLMIFDVLNWLGTDLRGEKLSKRVEILTKIGVETKKHIEIVNYTKDLINLWASALKEGWEGIIIKSPESSYIPKRTHSWLKIKCLKHKDIDFTSYEINPAGIKLISGIGVVCQCSGSQSLAVKKLIDEKGVASVEVRYLNETSSGALRMPTFAKLNED
jgi:ATP-dependent DNA ligase